MNSSGIKRGLATTAIAALAITGVPAIANAAPLATQEGASVTLRSVVAGETASVENDGTNSTISLVATAGAGVQFVTFFNGTTRIATVERSSTGEFQTEWTPAVGVATADITATATNSEGGALTPAGASDTEAAVLLSSTADAVEITPRAQAGYFAQPGDGTVGSPYGAANAYVFGVTGTTSQQGGQIALPAAPDALGVAADGTATVAGTGATRTFAGTVGLDKTAIDASATDVDQVLPVAETAAATPATTRDAQGFTVYRQVISGITATSGTFNNANGTSTVTVKVVDQNGQPVAGANVATSTAPAGNGNQSGLTDANGEVVFTGVAPGTETFYVDASNQAGFTNGVDRQVTVTVAAQRADSVTFESRDGNAFDLDEYDANDLRVRVLDAAGNPIVGETFFYTYTFDAFAAGVPNFTTNQLTATTDSQGYVQVPVPAATDYPAANRPTATQIQAGGSYTLNGFVNRDGSAPGQDAADLALTPATFKAGQSDVVFDGPASTDRQLGTTQTFTGSVELADGTGLVGRTLNVTYATAGDSAISATQPAGTTRLSSTQARVITQANGDFAVSVTDPAPATAPGVAETGTLTATGTGDDSIGTAPNQTDGIGTEETDSVVVNFRADAAPTNIVLTPDFDTTGNGTVATTDDENDSFEEIIDNVATPGRPVAFQVRLVNNQGTPLAGQQVTLTTSNGFFTPNRGSATTNSPAAGLTADPAPAQGNLYGEWASLGQSITVTTDTNGFAEATVAIEKDAGFDDDGVVNANITATSGTATNSSPITVQFRTDNPEGPLNPGSVEVVPESDEANVGDAVDLDVFAKDQFGNLVADQVVLSDNTNDAGFQGQAANGSVTVLSQYTSADNAAVAVAEEDVVQTITATYTQASNKYFDTDVTTPGFQAGRQTVANNSVTDTADIDWTEVNFGDFDITLTSSPEGQVQVNAPVTETVTVLDADGNPVAGVEVEFTRQGPGNQAGGDFRITNAQGQASYTFSSATVGTATVIAVVSDGQTGGQSETLTDTVEFVKAGPEVIRGNLSANNNGAKPDRLKVTTGKAAAAGAVVKFFRIKANGGSVQVGQAVLGADGSVKKNVKDINGKRFTKYFARVLPTEDTLGDRSNNTRVR